ncbi:MAG: lipase / esterase [Mycobacterium sp.]|nr:lipase / esterase [Mycobacterium sp.]
MSNYLVPELAVLADGFPKLDLADLGSTREFIRQAAAHRPVYDSNRTLSVTDVVVPGYQGEPEVAGRVYAPADAGGALPGLIYLFGGAYVAGSIDTIDYDSRMLADRAGIAVVAVAYRLAPENPYPAALNDAYAALQWATSSAAAHLGIDPSRIGVLGESAGGGLAASLALLARDRGGPRLTAQFLDAPTVDDRLATHSIRTLVDVPVWQPRNSSYSWGHYLRGTAQPGQPDVPLYAAPGRATIDDVADLPPAFVTSYQVDPTRDEGLHYALTLIRAAVPTDLRHYAGALHVAHSVFPGTTIGARMITDRLEAIERLLVNPQ